VFDYIPFPVITVTGEWVLPQGGVCCEQNESAKLLITGSQHTNAVQGQYNMATYFIFRSMKAILKCVGMTYRIFSNLIHTLFTVSEG